MICCDLFYSTRLLTIIWRCIVGRCLCECHWLEKKNSLSLYVLCWQGVCGEFVFPHCVFERHILILLSHTVKRLTEAAVCSQTQDQQHEAGIVHSFERRAMIWVCSICIYDFIDVLRQNTESLHSLAEQWARNEHVGCERTNPVDLFLWISFSLFSSLLAWPENNSALPCSAPPHNSPLSLFLSISSACPFVFQRSHLQRAAAERCPFKD